MWRPGEIFKNYGLFDKVSIVDTSYYRLVYLDDEAKSVIKASRTYANVIYWFWVSKDEYPDLNSAMMFIDKYLEGIEDIDKIIILPVWSNDKAESERDVRQQIESGGNFYNMDAIERNDYISCDGSSLDDVEQMYKEQLEHQGDNKVVLCKTCIGCDGSKMSATKCSQYVSKEDYYSMSESCCDEMIERQRDEDNFKESVHVCELCQKCNRDCKRCGNLCSCSKYECVAEEQECKEHDETFNFSEAMRLAAKGQRVSSTCWNNKKAYLYLDGQVFRRGISDHPYSPSLSEYKHLWRINNECQDKPLNFEAAILIWKAGMNNDAVVLPANKEEKLSFVRSVFLNVVNKAEDALIYLLKQIRSLKGSVDNRMNKRLGWKVYEEIGHAVVNPRCVDYIKSAVKVKKNEKPKILLSKIVSDNWIYQEEEVLYGIVKLRSYVCRHCNKVVSSSEIPYYHQDNGNFSDVDMMCCSCREVKI